MMIFTSKLSSSLNSHEIAEKISNVVDLYKYCEQKNYDAYWYSFPDGGIESVSVEDDDGKCYIAIDPFKLNTNAMELSAGLHEIGHCDGGAFYNRHATCDIRQKCENRADKIAIGLLLSHNDLNAAVADGCDSIWALADHFNVTEDFMRKAVCLYTYGNLDCKDFLPM